MEIIVLITVLYVQAKQPLKHISIDSAKFSSVLNLKNRGKMGKTFKNFVNYI